MKRKLFTAFLAGVLIIGLTTASFAGGTIKIFYNGKEIRTDNAPFNINGRVFAPVRAVAEAMGATVTWDQSNNQVNITGNGQSFRISNLERALAPKTAPEAAASWAEGVQTRNGAWQYAVMTPDLKKEFYEEFASLNWVTGTSSPWVKSFEVKGLGSAGDDICRYSVTFVWTDSTGSVSESTQHITVKNIDGTWLVDSVRDPDAIS